MLGSVNKKLNLELCRRKSMEEFRLSKWQVLRNRICCSSLKDQLLNYNKRLPFDTLISGPWRTKYERQPEWQVWHIVKGKGNNKIHLHTVLYNPAPHWTSKPEWDEQKFQTADGWILRKEMWRRNKKWQVTKWNKIQTGKIKLNLLDGYSRINLNIFLLRELYKTISIFRISSKRKLNHKLKGTSSVGIRYRP